MIASQLQEDLGVPVNVVNRTGGSGVVGHSAIANAAPDGYTIGIMTIEIDMMHWQGLTDLTYEDYDILALVNADPGGVMVAADSEYDSAEALLEAIKTQPEGTFKASGTGQGGIWHLGILGWILSEGLPPTQITWVPSEGANPGLTDMVAGGVDIVPSSLAEGRSLIEAGRVKALATMSDERQALFPDVPTLEEATGSDWTIAAWRSVVAPKGLPDDVKATLAAAVEAAYNSEEYQSFAQDRGFGLLWAGPEEATEIIAEADTALGDVMKQAGLAEE
jgi:tripartite-type tricarboxylate transporter receptor subunit TctC